MKKRTSGIILSLIAAGVMTVGTALSAFADQAVVTQNSVRIRSEASTSSSVVDSGANGQKFEILETVTGGDGSTWYKIKVSDSKTGFVRGDLVKVEASDGTTTTITTDTTANTASSNAPTDATPVTETTATVAGNNPVNIRSGAGTGYAKVAALDGGTSITLVGVATDDAGKKWYKLRCDSKNVEGFIREDLISMSVVPQVVEAGDPAAEGEVVEGAEGGEVTEGEEEYIEGEIDDEPVNNDYEIVYTADDEGNYEYYLYDHVNNTRQKVNDLLGAITNLSTSLQDANKAANTYKILTFVCAAVAVLFLVLMIIILVKNGRNDNEYYYDDDDDDDDDYDDEDDDDDDDDEDDEDDEEEERAPRRRVSQNTSAMRASRNDTANRRPRKPQNFLADDDEFEFEFLNMDDKD